MKCSFLILASVLAFSSFAKLPVEIEKLSGKPGIFKSTYNGKVEDTSGTNCEIKESPYGEGSVLIDSVGYFQPVAHLDGATKSVRNGITIYETTANGKRPGGSVCGDYSPLTSYKQTVTVSKNSISLTQKFTCAIFDRNEIIETCTLK